MVQQRRQFVSGSWMSVNEQWLQWSLAVLGSRYAVWKTYNVRTTDNNVSTSKNHLACMRLYAHIKAKTSTSVQYWWSVMHEWMKYVNWYSASYTESSEALAADLWVFVRISRRSELKSAVGRRGCSTVARCCICARQTLHVLSPDGSTFLCEMTAGPPSWKSDVTSEIRLRQSNAYLPEEHSCQIYHDRVRNDGAFCFFEEVDQ